MYSKLPVYFKHVIHSSTRIYYVMQTYHLLIKGRVQGVFFRASARDVAKKLNITGWIKNSEDGNVEALVTGEDDAIQKFIIWCRKGPPAANVTDVIVEQTKDTFFDDFRVSR